MDGGTQETTSQAQPWGTAQPYMRDVLSQAQNQYYGYNPQYYPGNQVAGFTPAGLAGQNYLQGYAGSVQPYLNTAQRSNAFLMNPNQLDVARNKYVSGNVQQAQNQITDNLMSNVLPTIRAQYRRGQPFGGSREEIAVGNAVEGTARAMGDTAAQMYGDAYRQNMSGMLQAQGLSPNMASLGMLPGTIMGDVGAQQQQLNQARINAAKQAWDYYQQLPLQKLGAYGNFATVAGGMGQTTTQETPGASPLASAIGLGSLGLGAYNAGLFGGGAAAGAAGAASAPLTTAFGAVNPLIGFAAPAILGAL